MYRRPPEVRRHPICNKSALRKNQGADLPFRGMLVDSNTAPVLGGDLPWWAVAVVVWSLVSKAYGKDQASRRRDVGAATLCSSLFRQFDFILQKMFAGRWLRMCWAISN